MTQSPDATPGKDAPLPGTGTRRKVMVIGASGGIGGAIAQRFASEGCAVHLVGRDEVKLQALASRLRAQGASIETSTCDLANSESIALLMDAAGAPDVLVNAAGSIPRLAIAETQSLHWRGVWADKVLGTIEACRLACDQMRASGGGVIVNIIGIAGVRLNPAAIMTSTANAALIAFTQALGAQSVDWNVRVVGINPGLTATPRTEGMTGGGYAALLGNLPMGRMAKAEEVADCTWFLASPQAAYISGTVIDIDAGARWRV